MAFSPADAGFHMTFSLDQVRRFFYAYSSIWNNVVELRTDDL